MQTVSITQKIKHGEQKPALSRNTDYFLLGLQFYSISVSMPSIPPNSGKSDVEIFRLLIRIYYRKPRHFGNGRSRRLGRNIQTILPYTRMDYTNKTAHYTSQKLAKRSKEGLHRGQRKPYHIPFFPRRPTTWNQEDCHSAIKYYYEGCLKTITFYRGLSTRLIHSGSSQLVINNQV